MTNIDDKEQHRKQNSEDYKWHDSSQILQQRMTRNIEKTTENSNSESMMENLGAKEDIESEKSEDNGQILESISPLQVSNLQVSKIINKDNKNSDKDNNDSGKMAEKEESSITKSDIKSIIRLLQQIASGVVELQGIKPYEHNEKGRETTRRGRTHVYKYLNYYDINNTIKRQGNVDPQDFDSPIYNRERIYEVLERYSDIIHVINGGTNPLFVIVSHEGSTNFSKESVIFPGEVKDFYNVYELRLRSPEAGLQYRATEYDIMSVSQTSLIPIELASLHDVSLPDSGDNWLETDIIPLVSPTTLRIEVAVSVSGVFSAAITNGENTQVVDFNVTSGPELIGDGVYVFELLVHKGDSINFRYSTDEGKIKILRVQEIDAVAA